MKTGQAIPNAENASLGTLGESKKENQDCSRDCDPSGLTARSPHSAMGCRYLTAAQHINFIFPRKRASRVGKREKWALLRNPQPVQLVCEVLPVHLRFVLQYAPHL